MLYFSAEKQPSIIIEFFNSIGTLQSLTFQIWVTVMVRFLPLAHRV
jgi:hypothetical protein